MSYILDALRKSEQERLRGKAVASLGQSAAPAANPRRYLIISALLGANLALFALFGWWWSTRGASAVAPAVATPAPLSRALASTPESMQGSQTSAPANPASPPASLDAGIQTIPVADTPPRVQQPLPRRAERIAPAPYTDRYVRPLPASDEDVAVAAAPPPARAAPALPRGVPGNFPALSLSTHIYSSDPGSRTVVINGMRLRQGDRLANGVEVVEITEDGARVRYQGQEALLNIAH